MIKNLSLFIISLFILACASYSSAAPVNVTINFAYNGTSAMETAGFKLYHKLPDGTEIVAVDMEDPTTRSWSGILEVPNGRSVFTLSAYNATEESGRSAEFPFEYIEPVTGGLPTPTVIIKFN
jgi:hypothetical protein